MTTLSDSDLEEVVGGFAPLNQPQAAYQPPPIDLGILFQLSGGNRRNLTPRNVAD